MRQFEGTMIPKGVTHSPIALEEGTVVAVFNVDKFQHEYVETNPQTGAFSETDAS